MAVTKLQDVIVPEIFTDCVIDETTEQLGIMTGGLIVNNPELNELVSGGGNTITMRSWNDLGGESEVITESNPLTPSNITSKSEVATVLIRGRAWGAHELAGALAGADPMKAIAKLVSKWWVRDEKKILLAILKGVFASGDMSSHVLDITSKSGDASKISGDAVLDAKQLLGDNSDLLSVLYMHSAVFTELQKQNMIQFIPISESKIQIPTYLGYRVLVDDSAPVDSSSPKKFTTYLLAEGSISRGVGNPVSLTPTETDRDSLDSTDYLINRKAFVLHPNGMTWKGAGSISKETPENTDLENGSYWGKAKDLKKIGLVKLVHTIESSAGG